MGNLEIYPVMTKQRSQIGNCNLHLSRVFLKLKLDSFLIQSIPMSVSPSSTPHVFPHPLLIHERASLKEVAVKQDKIRFNKTAQKSSI